MYSFRFVVYIGGVEFRIFLQHYKNPPHPFFFFFLMFEIQLYSDSKRKGMGMTVTNKIPPLNIVM